ncbi:MAG TPA: alcohol dehydrogenase, partial [Porticoccaceae bacterium]|nr:alcohol dehydrogenase [Porticoccaceae bacterium]
AGSVPALELAYRITARGGTTVTSGLPHPERQLSIQAVSLVAEERTLKGSYIGASVPSIDLPRYLALYEQGKLPVDKLLTHTLILDDVNGGFDRLASGEGIRHVIVM